MSDSRPASAPSSAGPAAAARLAATWSAARHTRSLFRSDDPQHAQEVVGSVFRPHRLALPSDGRAPLEAAMDYLPLGALSFSRLRYGRAVDILPGPLERFYLIQIPLRGQARIDTGRDDFHSHAGCAALLSPQPDLRMNWSADSDQLILRFDAEVVRRFCASRAGRDDMPAPVFAPQLRLDEHPELTELLLAVIALGEHAAGRGDDHLPAAPTLSLAQLQHRLLATLLAAQPHSARDLLDADGVPLAPRHVREIEDFLVAHPQAEVTPEALAERAGVSVRSLFLGFQKHRGVSPMKLLRELRLHRVRDELLLAAPGTTVTDVALHWGFFHLGRFSSEYRSAFGEPPSRTLVRHRHRAA